LISSKKAALAISLLAIATLWAYRIVSQGGSHALPAEFPLFALKISIGKCLMLAAIYVLLRLGGERFAQLGLSREAWPRHLAIGIGIGVAMFCLFNVGLASILGGLFPRAGTGPSVMDYFRNPSHLWLWLPIGIFGGGVVEELERIFVLTRFEQWKGRAGLVVGVILSSAMFGFGHLYQGLGGAIATGLSGALLAMVYLRRRSALEAIAAHALSDVLAILAATMLSRG
jgi:membrane protease YdiL (CAAX protease family)